MAAPEPPKERQLRVRSRKTTTADVRAAARERARSRKRTSPLSRAEGPAPAVQGLGGRIHGLRHRRRPGRRSSFPRIAGKGIVLYATRWPSRVPESSQVQVVFKKAQCAISAPAGRDRGERGRDRARSSRERTVRAQGRPRRRLHRGRPGRRAGGGLPVPRRAARRPLRPACAFRPPADSQLIISWRRATSSQRAASRRDAVTEDDISSLLQRHGLMLGPRSSTTAPTRSPGLGLHPRQGPPRGGLQEPIVRKPWPWAG